jgi:hypothetical protein
MYLNAVAPRVGGSKIGVAIATPSHEHSAISADS